MNTDLRISFLNLVRSLSPGQKRAISLYLGQVGEKESAVQQLFRLASKLDHWDEELVKDKIPRQRLDHTLNTATRRIFEVIRNGSEGTQKQVFQDLLDLQTAIQFDIPYFARKTLDRIISACKAEEKFELLVLATNIGINYFGKSFGLKDWEAYLKELKELNQMAFEEVKAFRELKEFQWNEMTVYQRLFSLTGESPQEGMDLDPQIKSVQESISQDRSIRRKAEAFAIRSYLFKKQGKPEKYTNELANFVSLYLQKEFLINENPILFLKRLMSLINFHALQRNEIEVAQNLKILEGWATQLKTGQFFLFQTIFRVFEETGQDYGIKASLMNFKRDLKKFQGELLPSDFEKGIYLAQIVSFALSSYSNCLFWGRVYFREIGVNGRNDIYSRVILHQLGAFIEEGDLDQWELLMQRLDQQIKNEEKLQGSALKFIKQTLIKLISSPVLEERAVFENQLKMMDQNFRTHPELLQSFPLDLHSWYQRRYITNRHQ